MSGISIADDSDLAPASAKGNGGWQAEFKIVRQSVRVGAATDSADGELSEATRCSCRSKAGEPICGGNR
jgi:hypothetical protein